MQVETIDNPIKEYIIEPQKELQIDLKESENITIKLEEGKAEIDGKELLEKSKVSFTNQNVRIYCWERSKITTEGNYSSKPFVSARNSRTMEEYIVAHYNICEMRSKALISCCIGPRVLVTGQNHSGKSAFCHMQLNYSLKLGWIPIFCDLALDNEISIPGSIAATVVDDIVPNDFMIDNSIILYTGIKDSNVNSFLYEKQITELANICKEKLSYDLNTWKKSMNIQNNNIDTGLGNFIYPESPTLFASGIIVHCPLIKLSIIQTIIREFDINLIYVIDEERLTNDLRNFCDKKQDKEKCEIILLSKLSGLSQNSNYKEYIEQQKLNSYFKGPFHNFKINEFSLSLTQYKLLQVTTSNVSSSMIPIGQSSDLNLVIKEYSTIDDSLLNRIVAIIYLDDNTINELEAKFENDMNNYVDLFSKAPVSFFGYINKIDKKDNTYFRLCVPCNQLMHKYLLIGDLKYSI